MKKIFYLITAFLFLFPADIRGQVVDRIAAVVNNEIITLSEMEEAGARFFHQVKESSIPSEREEKLRRARAEILNQLIENKLLDQEIKKRKVEVSEREVDAAIDDILKQNRMTMNDLKMALAKEGTSYSVYRSHIRDDLGKMRLINRDIKSKIVLNEEDLRKFYQENIKEYTDPLEVKVQQIFLPIPQETAEEKIRAIHKEAESLLTRARQGEDFAQLARDHSRSPEASAGGVLGFFKHKELLPELEEAAFKLKVGEISDLVRRPQGFHILRVLDRKGGEPKPFAEVQNRIREAKMQEEVEKKFKDWMQSLRAKAYVETRL
ncbi:MAG: hypothetical protein FJ117_11980 [Deltaproteobacteria bacterium]|nr:hypothetical protein [Deltaproteobacteria bacterium]